MKLRCSTTLFLGLLSINSFAQSIPSPIAAVSVNKIESTSLSIQNLSTTTAVIDIYGQEFEIASLSGLSFKCDGYSHLQIVVKHIEHDYFEVPCNSRVVFEKEFLINYAGAK